MKKLLILLVMFFAMLDVYGQKTTETATVNGITLKRTKSNSQVYIDNVKDTKMYMKYVYLNGTQVPSSLLYKYEVDDVPQLGFKQAMVATFNTNERTQFRGELVMMYMVFNNQGQLLEVSFIMDPDLKVANIPLSKFALWTQNLKKYVKATITKPETKQVQFTHVMVFYNFE